MNLLHMLLGFIVLLILLGMMNMMLNYIATRDGAQIPFRQKLWLIPLLSASIIVPLELCSLLYVRLFGITGSAGETLAPGSAEVLLSFPLFALIGFLLLECLVHPLVIATLRLTLKRDSVLMAKLASTLAVDTLLLYFIALLFPALPLRSLLQALFIALFYHGIEWLLIGVQTWLLHRKHARLQA